MIDGLYEIRVNTPMGEMIANVKLITKENTLNGYVEIMGKRNNFSGGKVKNNRFVLSGNLNVSIANIKYDLQGEVIGNILNVNAKTNMGMFNLQGKRIG